MPTLVIGMLAGLYLGNPQFRSQTDATIKNFMGKGVDMLNHGNGGAGNDTHIEEQAEE